MKCMCAQTKPRFIFSSERVFWGMEFEPMLTPREKSPLPENVPRGGSNPRRWTVSPNTTNELFRPPETTNWSSICINKVFLSLFTLDSCISIGVEGQASTRNGIILHFIICFMLHFRLAQHCQSYTQVAAS